MRDGNQIRWGIWGTGSIAHDLARDVPLVRDAILHAVASRTLARARVFAAQHGIAHSYEGLPALLDDPRIDVVYIASPNHCHVDDSLAAMQAGKAVLCEKPFALNLKQAERAVAMAREGNIFCMEAMWTRFIPAIVEAKRLIDAGAIGAPRLMQGDFAFPTSLDHEASVYRPERGGGVLLDRGVYLVSLAHHLFGVPEAIGGTAVMGPTGVDEQSAYQLAFSNGAIANLSASLQVRGDNQVTIFGEAASLRICEPFYRSHRLLLRSHATTQGPQKIPPDTANKRTHGLIDQVREAPSAKRFWRQIQPLLHSVGRGKAQSFIFPGNGYQFELREVCRCLRQGQKESVVMPLNDTLDVMRTMDTLRSKWNRPAAPKRASASEAC